MTTAHAFFPPSGAAETVACALWPTMNALYPQPETEASREGTAAHWVGDEVYHGRVVAEGQIAPNGVMLTEEIIESGVAFAESLDGDWTVERTIGDTSTLNWGTPDARRLQGTTAGIKDLKHGFLPVDAFGWWQGINYAKLLVEHTWARDKLPESTVFELEVIQPRVYRGRSRNLWTVTLGELRPYFARLDQAHADALSPTPQARTGPQCDYCPGRHACPTLQESALRIAHHSGESPPMELTDQALGREAITMRRAIKLMQARLTGLEADAEARLAAGRAVAFHALVSTQGRETYSVSTSEAIAVAAACGVDISKPGIMTPAQARKAGLADEVVAAISHRPGGARKLVEDDGREAAKVFDGNFKVS